MEIVKEENGQENQENQTNQNKKEGIPFSFEIGINSQMIHTNKGVIPDNLSFFLEPSDNLVKEKYIVQDGAGGLSQEGVRVFQMVVIQSLVANIKFAEQKGYFNREEMLEQVKKQIQEELELEMDIEVTSLKSEKTDEQQQ